MYSFTLYHLCVWMSKHVCEQCILTLLNVKKSIDYSFPLLSQSHGWRNVSLLWNRWCVCSFVGNCRSAGFPAGGIYLPHTEGRGRGGDAAATLLMLLTRSHQATDAAPLPTQQHSKFAIMEIWTFVVVRLLLICPYHAFCSRDVLLNVFLVGSVVRRRHLDPEVPFSKEKEQMWYLY